MTIGGDLASACAELAQLDTGRLVYGRDYTVNLQATRNQAERQGRALGPLIVTVDPAVFQRPTFSLFLNLFDNYKRMTGTAETFGPNELREQSDFLDACMQTRCMQFVHQWLSGRQIIGSSPQQFKAALTQMWFALYRREVQNDSSGFEHVFLGESDHGVVKGLHSWIQFHLEERRGKLQYRGYLNPRSRGGARIEATPQDRVISVHFGWMNETKAVSSIIMGSTPEFEMALYTLCFLGGQEENHVWLEDYELNIKAYRIRSKYGDKIGSVFPELLSKGGGGSPAAGSLSPAQQPAAYSHQAPYQAQKPAGGGAGQQQSYHPQQAAWHQQQAQTQQQNHQAQNQANPNDTTAQGCINLLGAILGFFCSSNKKNQQRN